MMTRVLRANAFGLLPLLCALYLILYLDRVNIATAAPLIQSELHLRNAALGVVLSAFAYSYAFCQLIGGFVGERFRAATDSVGIRACRVCRDGGDGFGERFGGAHCRAHGIGVR